MQAMTEYFNDNALCNTEILHQESSTVQPMTANDNDIGNTEILHMESSRSTNSAAAYLPPMIMTIALTATMATFLTILMAQKLISV